MSIGVEAPKPNAYIGSLFTTFQEQERREHISNVLRENLEVQVPLPDMPWGKDAAESDIVTVDEKRA
ncbi:MAG: hypothetical protein M1827_007153 [Pycnora praestabilis]|nr:MAG: hypothetical protein M1827_007153 [Pycnora praestabilis]